MQKMIFILVMSVALTGCALITTPVKVVGVAATTTIKVAGTATCAGIKTLTPDGSDDQVTEETVETAE